MTVTTIVNIVYCPTDKKLIFQSGIPTLRYHTGDSITVSNTASTTQFKFIFPSEYSSYTAKVAFTIPSDSGTSTTSTYTLDSDNCFVLPSALTSNINKLLSFKLIFTNSSTTVEQSSALYAFILKPEVDGDVIYKKDAVSYVESDSSLYTTVLTDKKSEALTLYSISTDLTEAF